jgi:hypothetical protein
MWVMSQQYLVDYLRGQSESGSLRQVQFYGGRLIQEFVLLSGSNYIRTRYFDDDGGGDDDEVGDGVGEGCM